MRASALRKKEGDKRVGGGDKEAGGGRGLPRCTLLRMPHVVNRLHFNSLQKMTIKFNSK